MLELASDVSPFFGSDYLTQLYAGGTTLRSIFRAYLERIRRLVGLGSSVNLLWVEKEALPWFPWPFEKVLLPRKIPLVTDYDDAVFHRYDQHRSAIVRRVLARKIDSVMAASALVTAGNAYLANRARAAGAAWVEIVPTVVDVETYIVRPPQTQANDPPRIGWIGTPSTWTEYMAPMMPMISHIALRHGARISAIGASAAAMADPMLDILPWSEESEVARIQEMDIGIMPLTDTPWARGKCGYKLIQYMACGVPVIASPVGVNADIVEHGVNGFLAASEDEWRTALVTLLRDPVLRRRMGLEGRRKVEEHYSLQVWGPKVAGMLREVAERAKRSKSQ